MAKHRDAPARVAIQPFCLTSTPSLASFGPSEGTSAEMNHPLDNIVVHAIALAASIGFSAIAGIVPPNAGNFVGGLFVATLASFLGGEEVDSSEDAELADLDV